MVRTRRSRQAEGKKLAAGLALIGLAVAVATSVGVVTVKAAKDRVAVDSKTQCPLSGPRSITIVMIDRTDPVAAITERDLSNRLRDLASETPKYGALYLYTIDGGPDGLGEPLFFRCNPGDASSVSDLTGSKRKVQARFQTEFADPLDRALKDLLVANKAPHSPIMEAVQSGAVTAFASKTAASTSPRHLIIASDFMQNSDRVSFYGGGRGSHLEAPEVLDAPLTDVAVSLLFIQRPDRGGPGIDELKSVWREYFIQSGVAASQVRSIKLTGANP